MQWLTALLAFAVTMLIFAIIVSTFVEMIHRMWNLRAKGMQLMLENIFENVVEPYLETGEEKSDFALRIMQNRASKLPHVTAVSTATKPEDANKADSANKSEAGDKTDSKAKPSMSEFARNFWEKIKNLRIVRWLYAAFDFQQMTDIPVEVFLQKLGEGTISEKAKSVTEDVLKDISQKYVAYGNEIGTYFERRARLLSVIVAFFVAWAFFVHPYNMAVKFIRSPEVAAKVAAMSEGVQKDYKDQVVDFQKALAAAGKKTDPADAKKAIDAAIVEFEKAKAAADKTVKDLEDLGVPVGWPDKKLVKDCVESDNPAQGAKETLVGFCKYPLPWVGDVTFPMLGNIFWLLAGGLLVGLGSPFWAQAVSKLTATGGLAEKITGIVGQGQAAQQKVASREVKVTLPGSKGIAVPLPDAGVGELLSAPQETASPLKNIFNLSRQQPKKK